MLHCQYFSLLSLIIITYHYMSNLPLVHYTFNVNYEYLCFLIKCYEILLINVIDVIKIYIYHKI